MGFPTFREFVVPAANGNSDEIDVSKLNEKSVQILGTFSASLTIEGSLDGGTTFAAIGSAVTAPEMIQVPGTYQLLRINVASYVSGDPRAILGGVDHRSR